MFRAALRAAWKGLTTEHMTTPPRRTNSEATKPIRWTFVSRSALLNPRPFDRCVRTTSPSKTVTLRPRSRINQESISAVVDFPDPLSPVNQIHIPFSCFFD